MAHCTDSSHTERRPNNGGKHGTVCVECSRAAGRRKAAAHNRRYRQLVLDAYGSKCACCGETEPVFLTLDHVGGGGNEHRRSLGVSRSTTNFYRLVIKEGYPPVYRLLCHNCNYATSRGECPHLTAAQFAALL